MSGLSVHSTGTGPDVVLIHGWGMNRAIWGEVMPILERHLTLHCVDLPGHGRSSLQGRFTIENIVDAIADSVPSEAVWLGWSLGGLCAMVAAQRYTHRVSKLVLVSSTPCFVQREGWAFGVDAAVYRQFGADLAADYRKTLKTFIALQTLKSAVSNTTRRVLQTHLCEGGEPDPKALSGGLEILCDTDFRSSLSGLTQPTLIIQGGRDVLVNAAAADYLSEHIPGAQLEKLAVAGHAPMISDVEPFANAVLEFIHG